MRSSFTSSNTGASSDLHGIGELGKQATCKPHVGWCAERVCGLTHNWCTDGRGSRCSAVFSLGGGGEGRGRKGRGGGWQADHAAAASQCSSMTQGEGHLKQAQETRGSREGWGQRPSGQVHVLSEATPGCHWCQLFSAFTSPGVRTGRCEAETRLYTASPWQTFYFSTSVAYRGKNKMSLGRSTDELFTEMKKIHNG